MIYLDTNIFIYASNKKSLYYPECKKLLKLVGSGEVQAITSSETIQEIIYFMRRVGELNKALLLSHELLEIVDLVVPVDKPIIKGYLGVAEKYGNEEKIESRDFIHLATCIEYKIFDLVTYDKDFEVFREIVIRKPSEIVGVVN